MNDAERLAAARELCFVRHPRMNIGTYKERSQHFILKNYFEPDTNCQEVKVGKYVADIKNDSGIYEIQTSGFGALKAKLEVFLSCCDVCVVYPCAVLRRVCWCDTQTGEITAGSYRTYNKAAFRLLSELLDISDFFPGPGLTVKLCRVKVSDYRLLDGYGEQKKKKATKTDTVTDEIIDITDLKCAADVLALLPFCVGDRITRSDISSKTGLRRMSLWRAVTFLCNIGLLVKDGKVKNSIVYRVCGG